MKTWVDQAREGSLRAATRLITQVENDPSHLHTWFHDLADWPQPRLVLGITGPPGAGKSTLVDALLTEWRRREPEQRLGVLAVDPSSPFTGGAILGDRVRMMQHATDPKIFIRSLATRGHLGGLTLGIRSAVRIMGLAGCDVVIVETVGIGQSEIEVASVADFTMMVLAPGQGDGVQMLKAGVMEAGDMFVVNKADRPDAERVVAELQATLSLTGNPREAEVYAVSAVDKTGIDALVDGVEARRARLADRLVERRAATVREEVRAAVHEAVRRRIEGCLDDGATTPAAIAAILRGEQTVEDTARRLMRCAALEEASDSQHPDDSKRRRRETT